MANKQDIEFAIKGNDLATKPLTDIGAAIGELVKSVAALVPASEAGERNLNELREVANNLKTTLKNLAADQGTIDQFTKLNESIAASEQTLLGLRAAAEGTHAALVAAEAPTRGLTKANTDAEKAVTRGEVALARLNKQLETVKLRAAGAGIDTVNLAQAQQLLDSAFNAAAPALARVNATTAAYAENQKRAAAAAEVSAAAAAREAVEVAKYNEQFKQTGHAASEAERGTRSLGGSVEHLTHEFSLFRDEGRTTLSIFQRLRGELLSLTAQFIGFYGAIEAVKSGFESIEKMEGAKRILETTFGKKTGEEMKFVADEAERLALNDDALALSYAKFTASAAGSLSPAKMRATFSVFAEIARVQNQSAEDTTTMFEGLGKVFAKDTVAFGDLYKRMDSTMPGIAKLIREAVPTADGTVLNPEAFNEFIKSGKFTGEMLADLAPKLHAIFATQLPAATNTAGAALVKLDNAFDDLKRQVLEGGALQVFTQAIKDVSDYLKTGAGEEFVAHLASGLKLIAEGFALIARNVEAFKLVLEIAFGAFVLNQSLQMIASLNKMGAAILVKCIEPMQAFGKSLGTVTQMASTLTGRLNLMATGLAAFMAGFEVGTWLYDNVAVVRKFGDYMIGAFVIILKAATEYGPRIVKALFTPGASAMAEIKKVGEDIAKQWAEAGAAAGVQDGPASKPRAAPDAAGAHEKAKTAAELAAEDKAARELVLAGQLAAVEGSFKAITNKLFELRGSLLKKSDEDMKTFLASFDLQMQPLRAEIETLSKNPLASHNSAERIAGLTAQLGLIRDMAKANKQDEIYQKIAKDKETEITEAFKQRAIALGVIRAQEGLTLTHANAQVQLNAATEESNARIGELIKKLQLYISTLPAVTQRALKALTGNLQVQTAELTDRPDTKVPELQETGAVLLRTLQQRDDLLKQQQSLTKAHLQTTEQERENVQKINREYDGVLEGMKAMVVYLRTSDDLTADQKALLADTAMKLENAVIAAKQLPTELYSSAQAANDMANGLTKVGAAFAKSVGTGRGLAASFRAAGLAFRQFASDFLLQIGEMILKAILLKALSAAIGGGGSAAGGVSGFVGAVMALGSTAHTGGMVGQTSVGVRRPVRAEWFHNAPHYHSGGAVAGLRSGDVPAILQTGEEVLARGDARNAANGGRGSSNPQHIQVINAIDHASVVRAGLAAPSNQKVILNIMRANRGAVKQVLG